MAPLTARRRSTGTPRPLPGPEAHHGPATKAKKCVNPYARFSPSFSGRFRFPVSAATIGRRLQLKRALDGSEERVHDVSSLGMGLTRTRMMRDHTSHRCQQPLAAQSVRLLPLPPPLPPPSGHRSYFVI